MAKLESNWLTEGILDFEYKKYVLMAYLQHIDSQFTENRLYPHLQELKMHFESCVSFRDSQNALKTSFPKNVTGIDQKTWNLVYEETFQEDSYLSELNYVLDFAIPSFSAKLTEGNDRFSEVGENIRISPVGIVPLRVEEGYLFFFHSFKSMITIFQYQLALYNERKERFLKTVFIDSVRLGLGNSVAQIKVDLAKKNKALPNPATYIVESKYDYPLHETLLPVVQRLMVQQLNVA